MKWTRRILVASAATAALVLPVVVPVARADSAAIGGFQMVGNANGISFIYDQPSFGLPAAHTFELHKSHAETAIDSGPTSHGLGSILWPGDLVGNAPAGLAANFLVFDPTSGGYLAPVVDAIKSGATTLSDQITKNNGGKSPSYPIRAESFYPQGPKDNDYAPGGGVTMTSHADDKITSSTSSLQQAGFPGLLSIGLMQSSSLSGIVDGQAVSEARAIVNNVDLAGVLHIGHIDSYMKAVSDGVKATLTKTMTVTGVTIGGQGIVVDSTGMHAGGQSVDPLGQLSAALIDQYLKPNGISLTVPKPITTITGGTASGSGQGMVITMSATEMNKLVSMLPAPIAGWLRNPTSSPLAPLLGQLSSSANGFVALPFQFDQNVQINLGDVTVNAAASPAYNVTIPPLSIPPLTTGIIPPGITGPTILPGSTGTDVLGQQQQQTFGITPVAAVAIPIGFVLLALLLMLAGATGLDKMATAATSSVAAEDCPLEKP
jgi:hypothetical protein